MKERKKKKKYFFYMYEQLKLNIYFAVAPYFSLFTERQCLGHKKYMMTHFYTDHCYSRTWLDGT